MGVTVEESENGVMVSIDRPLRSVDVKTLPYPGFPTDMQSQMMALLMVTDGTGIVTETVFENRFMHVEQFRRMRGQIKVEGRTAIVSGNCKLKGAKVCATDLRAGAALVLAALAAEGETEITGVHHIDRGYVGIDRKLCALGAEIRRLEDDGQTAEETADAKHAELPRLVVQPTWA
jgi:UDP-N-acetylglucosamine 1-carboxyvinyltransferase